MAGPNRIPYVKTQIPEKIEDLLGDILNAAGVLAVMEEHDIDVRVRVQFPTTISSGGHERYLLSAAALIAHVADNALKQLLHEDINHLGNGAYHPDTIGTFSVTGADYLTVVTHEMPGTGKIEGSFFLEGSPSGVTVSLVLVREIPIDIEVHSPVPKKVFLPQSGAIRSGRPEILQQIASACQFINATV